MMTFLLFLCPPSQTSLAALASAREKGDFEAATRSIQRAMAVDRAISGSAFAEAVVVSAFHCNHASQEARP